MTDKKLRVAVLFGGQSVEHDVSLISARSIINALDPEKYEAIPVAITRQGHWLPPTKAAALLGQGPGQPSHESLSSSGAKDEGVPAPGQHPVTGLAPIQVPQRAIAGSAGILPATGAAGVSPAGSGWGGSQTVDFQDFDVVFPVVHGTQGEDGTLQGLLELAGIPYVGAGVLASAVGMDKATMKRVFRDAGLPQPRFLVVLRHEWGRDRNPLVRQVAREIGYPCFVKPSNGGSSVGVAKVRTEQELVDALDDALQLDRKALVEEAIPARELECSVIGNDEPIASAVGEVLPFREFYDYEAKYHDARTGLVIPAQVPEELASRLRAMALRAFRAVDCAGMARVDFFLRTSDNTLFLNEINTIPGFTNVSMYPKLWEASGVPYAQLVDRLIQLALERHQETQATRARYAITRREEQ